VLYVINDAHDNTVSAGLSINYSTSDPNRAQALLVSQHFIQETLRYQLALILARIDIFATIKLVFFIIGVDIGSHSIQNVFTYDTNLSHAKCAFQ